MTLISKITFFSHSGIIMGRLIDSRVAKLQPDLNQKLLWILYFEVPTNKVF